MNKSVELSIVVPVYNEGETVASVLTDLKKELDGKITHEIIVVNDGSTDNSCAILETIPYIKLVNHTVNSGYGSALKTGIKNSRYNWVLTFDSDGSHPSHQIMDLVKFCDSHDLIIGARTGEQSYDTFFRKIGRKIVTKFAQYISGVEIEDINSGFRIFKKELPQKFWPLLPDGFSFSSTSTVASHVSHYPVKYVSINANKRAGGKSTVRPAKDFVGFLSLITKIAIYFKPLKVFIPISIFLFVSAILVLLIGWFAFGGVLDITFAILIMAAIQSLTFGLIAEMIVKRFY